LNKIVNAALNMVTADDLKRLQVLRTASLRTFLERRHPTEWTYKIDAPYLDFLEQRGSANEHCKRPDCGLFWYVEEPLAQLYESKLRGDLVFSKQMSTAKKDVKAAKSEKNKAGLDLKKRLKAAKKEADAEFTIGELGRQKKREGLEKRNQESERAAQLRLMRELAKSTEVLVASLRSDGIDVEKYFRDLEIEERREAWDLKFKDMEPVEVEDVVEAQEEEDEEEIEVAETELQRRDRLRLEAKAKREFEEHDVDAREIKELKRIAMIKEKARQLEKEVEKKNKLDIRDGNRWALDRKHELNVREHKVKKEQDLVIADRKEKFKKYQMRLENKAARKRREEESEWKTREQSMEKLRMQWFDEAEEKRKQEEAEAEQLRLEAERNEQARLDQIQEVKRQKDAKLAAKRRKFLAFKQLSLARLGNATWMKKDGAVVFYDAVDWKDSVKAAKEDMVSQGLLEKEEVVVIEEEEEEEEKEKEKEETIEVVKDDLGEYTIIKQGEEAKQAAETAAVAKPKSEWVDEVDVDGKKYQTHIVTGEMRYVK
jgi:hypothetical protein